MPRLIERDYKHFIDIISGKLRESLKKHIDYGSLYRFRANGGRVAMPLPRIINPRFTYGNPSSGILRGPGKPGDVIDQDEQGKGRGGGGEESDGMIVSVELDEIIDFWQEQLHLPDLKPKFDEVFDEKEPKYNGISLHGPESLRHMRKTIKEAIKRQAASGENDDLHYVPGEVDPVRLIVPINRDKRYRQRREVFKPSSNALIVFGRDGSGSMGDEHCDIINDMSWWIRSWIKKFYKHVQCCYFWHDVMAKEVDEDTFFSLRGGGGTVISSVFDLVAEQFENRFPPDRWNIYFLYFTDGENRMDDENGSDNHRVIEIIKDKFDPSSINLLAVTQILCRDYEDSFKKFVDDAAESNVINGKNLRTVSIGPEDKVKNPSLSKKERGEAINHAIKTIFGNKIVTSSGVEF